MNTHGIIRRVQITDAPALLAIYQQYIDTPITFEIALPDLTTFEQRITNIASGYPYLVYEENGMIKGYAYAHRHKERWSYQWNAELSVYLDQAISGKGMGRRMYQAVIDILQLQNIKNVYGCVTAGNPKSEGLHEAMGFRRIGTFSQAGFKAGKWHDVLWFEKTITTYENPPIPLKLINEFDDETINEILSQAMR